MTKQEYQEYKIDVAEFLRVNSVDGGCYGPKTTEDTDRPEPFFSWHPCHCCHSAKGGDRETYVFATTDGGNFEADICVDCVYYLEYGQLDDATMAEVAESA